MCVPFVKSHQQQRQSPGMGMPEMGPPAHFFFEQEAVEAADEGHDALQQCRAVRQDDLRRNPWLMPAVLRTILEAI
jgi:hypothetical protein